MEDYSSNDEQHYDVYLTLFDNSMLLDEDTFNDIINLLNKLYFNHLFVLFFMSSVATLYICTSNSSTKKNNDYIMINNIEPNIMKGEIICKV